MTRGNRSNIFAGAALFVFGCVGVILSRPLRFGSLSEMGPGFTPTALGVLIAVTGLAILAGGFMSDHEPASAWEWRQLFFILAAILFFPLALEWIGLFGAVLGSVLVAAPADSDMKIGGSIMTAFVLAVLSCVIFVLLLRVQIPIANGFI